MKNKLILLKKTMAMIIKTLQGQIMLLDTTNKSDFLIRDILVRAQKKLLLLMDKYLSLIIIQNYSMKQRFLRMILKNLISMKSPSLTKGKRNPANEKLIYLIFQQGYSIILFLRKSLMRNSLKVTMNFLQKYTSDFSLFQRHS